MAILCGQDVGYSPVDGDQVSKLHYLHDSLSPSFQNGGGTVHGGGWNHCELPLGSMFLVQWTELVQATSTFSISTMLRKVEHKGL